MAIHGIISDSQELMIFLDDDDSNNEGDGSDGSELEEVKNDRIHDHRGHYIVPEKLWRTAPPEHVRYREGTSSYYKNVMVPQFQDIADTHGHHLLQHNIGKYRDYNTNYEDEEEEEDDEDDDDLEMSESRRRNSTFLKGLSDIFSRGGNRMVRNSTRNRYLEDYRLPAEDSEKRRSNMKGNEDKIRRPSPPLPVWKTLNFRLTDGNRTIYIRRYIRKPNNTTNHHRGQPVYLYRPVLYKPATTTTTTPTPPTTALPERFVDLSTAAKIREAKKRIAKFLSLFTIIKFPNDACLSPDGAKGTCYHSLECKSLGGIASGTCARGFGVCCIFMRTCGAITNQNCTYFVNPGFPMGSTDLMACTLTVNKLHDVTQLRLDFLDFELAQPVNGTCVEDQFIVSGQNTNSIVPVLCGFNTGQHVYMDVDATTGPYRLSVLSMGGSFPRMFRIKVTQLRPGYAKTAPKNCLQYYTGVRGTIESFNYQGQAGYLNNLNYAICIRKEDGYCSITYTNRPSNGTEPTFQLLNVDEDGEPIVPPGQAGAEAFNCPDDYIIINGIRLCGERLNDASVTVDFTQDAPVTDTSSGPFVVPVRTNGNTVGRGFLLDYMQNRCMSGRRRH
ncbi:uncharacterized protein [Anabrus simplex]|uniref:uncharacterized protein n=1 Tax=Anabrus simplex TaxID=316456 RepID=UPI0035A26976